MGSITASVGPPPRLSTSAVASASGYSAQQIRDLERLGVIPPARRASNGYREFSAEHVRALRAYRGLAVATGPVVARRSLREMRGLPLDRAAALISSLHIALARERDDALAAQHALRMIRAEAAGAPPEAAEDAMTITELAAALGVRPSTLRFWEHVGLVAPERVTSLATRRYPLAAIREARITASLRAAGYRIPDVQRTMASIRRLDDVDDPLRALHGRLDAIAERTLALLTAGADITALLRSSGPSSPKGQARD